MNVDQNGYILPVGKVLVLRTCAADLSAHEGFIWPRCGDVEAPDWDPEARCGHGLHGFLWGEGDGLLADHRPEALWLVVEVDAASIVKIDDQKVKFPRGNVIYCGNRITAVDTIARFAPVGTAINWNSRLVHSGEAITGFSGTSISGPHGNAVSGDEGIAIAGHNATASAGSFGVAVAGAQGTAIAGGFGVAVAGEFGSARADDGIDSLAFAKRGGTAQAGGYSIACAYAGTATSGFHGTAVVAQSGTARAGELGIALVSATCHGHSEMPLAEAGQEGMAISLGSGYVWTEAMAGPDGIIIVDWRDKKRRRRITVGYVGEDGILPGVAYFADPNNDGKLVPARKREK